MDEPKQAYGRLECAWRLPRRGGGELSQKSTVTELTVEEKLKCASSLNRLNNAVKDMLWQFPQELREELEQISAKLEGSVTDLIEEDPLTWEPEYKRIWLGKVRVLSHLRHGFARDPSCELCRDEDRIKSNETREEVTTEESAKRIAQPAHLPLD